MNTTFGMSIWEQVAVILAKDAGYHAERQYRLLGEIDEDTEKVINEIHYQLRKGEVSTNKKDEIEKNQEKDKERTTKRGPRLCSRLICKD
ncbi:MAG: TdeIII family type II restriction endonuclease [Leptonema sp. (in: bacteria)]